MPDPALLELTLGLPALAALSGIPGLRLAGRSQKLRLEWHDTPGGALIHDGLTLCRSNGTWRLTRAAEAWHPGTLLAETRDLVALGPAIPGEIGIRAEWEGTRRLYRWTGPAGVVHLVVLEGRFIRRGPVPPSRLSLDGPGAAVAALMAQLIQAGASLPRSSLAQEALQVAPAAPAPAPLPLDPAQQAGPVLAAILGAQLRLMLFWAARIPGATGPEPVHQMRVATRRLRAALSTFRPVATSPALAAIAAPLKDCAAQLGAARDWDVFMHGAGARLAAAFPGDARCAAMLRAGVRRRRKVYRGLQAYLTGAGFRTLAASLALLAADRPWPDGPEMPGFAAARLAARLRTVRRAGRGIAALPVPALHELRKDCKRLRYTAEFFQPLFGAKPSRRFLRALADLQEELGLLNDGSAVGGLMAQLGRSERGYAAGLAEGFTAAQSNAARSRIVKAWRDFRAVKPFWPDVPRPPRPKPPAPVGAPPPD